MITPRVLFPVDDDPAAAAGAFPTLGPVLAAGPAWRRVCARQEVAH